MVMYSFQLENFEKWLNDFALQLNTTVSDRILTVPSGLGEGIILARNVNPHFSYAVMNFRLNSDLEMHRESVDAGFVISFTQVEVPKDLLPGHHQAIADKRPFRNDIFLSDARDNASVRIAAGSTVKRLLIFSSHELAM